jgi:WD40 repeat protein
MHSATPTMDNDPSDVTQGIGPAQPARLDADGRLPEGSTLGQFTIRRLIGSGGMGRVYEARQENPRRTVAIKVMSRGLSSASALRRFEFEAQVLGRLRHPGIAQILEAGRLADGATPWFAMEYIANAKPITDYARDNRLSTRDRVRLFRQACEALSHGHQRGIIHRDLKPSNILVDGAGHVKVIDFGVARTTDSDMAVTTLQTDVGQLVGTVQYMSPEQFDADPHDIDIRSDVYALGVVLYELLTDRCPYELSRKAIHEAARIVREEEPPRPSSIQPALRGDLEVIVGTAMAKDRTRRFGSAHELSQDLGRWLEGEPIAARAPGVLETIRRFARRHRAAAAAIATAFVLLSASLVVVIRLLGVANERNIALERETINKDAALAEANDQKGRAEALAAERNQALARLGAASYAGAMRVGMEAVRSDDATAARQALADARDSGLQGVESRFEFRLLKATAEPELLSIATGAAPMGAMALSPDARTAATTGSDGTIRLWDTSSGAEVTRFKAHNAKVNALAFSPDGRTLASASDDTTVRLWNARATASAPLAELRGHTQPVQALAWSPDGGTLASSGSDREIRLWNALSFACTRTITGHAQKVVSLAFSPDGARIASGSADRSARMWDVTTGAPLASPLESDDTVVGVAFLEEGRMLAAASADGAIRFATDATAPAARVQAPGGIRAIAPLGADSLAVATTEGTFTATPQGCARQPLAGASGASTRLALDSRGSLLATGDSEGTLRLWALQASGDRASLTPSGFASSALLALTGPGLLVGAADGRTLVCDPLLQRPIASLAACADGVTALAASPDGRLLARGSRGGLVELWNGLTGERIAALQERGQPITGLAISPDARALAVADSSGRLELIDLASRSGFARLAERGAAIQSMTFSRDGASLLTGGADGSVRLWDPAARKEIAVLGGHDAAVNSIALSSDGSRAISGCNDGAIRLWDMQARKPLTTLATSGRPVTSVAFDPTGSTIAVGSTDGTIGLWDVASARRLGELRPGVGPITAIAFDPIGASLLIAGDGGTRVMRAESAGAVARRRSQAEASLTTLRPSLQSWIQAGGLQQASQEVQRAPAADQPALRDLLLLEGPSGLR